jgi:hypothetical protein
LTTLDSTRPPAVKLAGRFSSHILRDTTAASTRVTRPDWKYADPDIPILKQAKAEYAKFWSIVHAGIELAWIKPPARCSLQLNGLPSNCPPKQAISKLFFSALAA